MNEMTKHNNINVPPDYDAPKIENVDWLVNLECTCLCGAVFGAGAGGGGGNT
ncbi:MAG: hypothetical protein ACRCYY_06690 [Trueperaceae bacterium]